MPRALPSISQIDRLLIVKTSSIGDVVHALPVAEAFKKARPSLSVGWLVRRRCADVLAGNPHIDRLHVVNDKPNVGDLVRLRDELHSCGYQCALDMQGLFLSGLCTWLSTAPIRLGIDRNREQNALFMTHPIIPGKPAGRRGVDGITATDRHAVDILYGFAEALGAPMDHTEFAEQPYLAADPQTDLDAAIRALPSPRIGLSVGASSAYKRWPAAHWSILADRLTATGAGVVFVGDKRDAETVKSVLAGCSAQGLVVDASGKTTLRQLAAVLRLCDVVVSADSGPMHLAVAVGTPVVALFGSTNPDRTGPYGRRNTVLNMRLPCSPCYRKPTCDGRVDCMQAITPEAVCGAVEEKLQALSDNLVHK